MVVPTVGDEGVVAVVDVVGVGVVVTYWQAASSSRLLKAMRRSGVTIAGKQGRTGLRNGLDAWPIQYATPGAGAA